MKSTDLFSTTVAVPTRQIDSSRPYGACYLAVLIEVHTDAGRVGLGAAPNLVIADSALPWHRRRARPR